jgi:hypothetical protein
MIDQKPLHGEKVGSVQRTLALAESQPCDLSRNLNIGSINLQHGTTYIFEIEIHQGKNGKETLTKFATQPHEEGNSISIPLKVVKNHEELQPGRTIRLTAYKQNNVKNEIEQTGSSTTVLSVVKSDSSEKGKNSDGIKSGLPLGSQKKLLPDSEFFAQFRNLRNDEVDTELTEVWESKDWLSFPKPVRENLDVEIGDEIEIVVIDESDNQQRIEEIYEMVSELYEAYQNNVGN